MTDTRKVIQMAENVHRFEFDAATADAVKKHYAAKNEATQNEEGVHVGDLFYTSWGWEQTNVDFYQVVALNGKHTVVLREIVGEYIGGFGWSGQVRPIRDEFVGDDTFTVRTKMSTYNGAQRVIIRSDKIYGGNLYATTDFEQHAYSSYA